MNRDADCVLQEFVNLKPFNTFGIAATARYFTAIKNPSQLQNLLHQKKWQHQPLFLLGGGSNVLFKNDFTGLIIKNDISGIQVISEDKKSVLLEIGAGENWHELVMTCVEKRWYGIENLALIPGTVGAAPIQNIGAYGVELESVFHSLDAIHLKRGETEKFLKQDCQFGYRDSIFKNALKGEYAVTNIRLKLSKIKRINADYSSLSRELKNRGIEDPGIKEVAEAVIAIRRRKLPDPARIGNAGSFFKNPVVDKRKYEKLKSEYADMPGYYLEDNTVKIPAGWLIEKAGWKGKSYKSAGVHPKQALVLTNQKNATAAQILCLARKIKIDIRERFDIKLQEEVNIIG